MCTEPPPRAALRLPEQEKFFEEKIRPILATNCLECHGAKKAGIGSAARLAAGGSRRRRQRREGRRARRARPQPAGQGGQPRGRHHMPPERKLNAEQIAVLTEWVRQGRPVAGRAKVRPLDGAVRRRPAKPHRQDALGLSTRSHVHRLPTIPQSALGNSQSDRCLCPGQARSRRPDSIASGRPPHAHSPRHLRPARPAADARRSRALCRRHFARCLRAAGRSAARLAALRRALGPALARRRPLRRHQGLRLRQGPALSVCLHLSRLRDPGASTRTCPTTSSSCEQLAADQLADTATTSRTLAALGFLTTGRKFNNQQRRHRRPDRRRRPRPPGPDRRLRPLPRPQVRRDSDRRLLLAVRRLRELFGAERPAADRPPPEQSAEYQQV